MKRQNHDLSIPSRLETANGRFKLIPAAPHSNSFDSSCGITTARVDTFQGIAKLLIPRSDQSGLAARGERRTVGRMPRDENAPPSTFQALVLRYPKFSFRHFVEVCGRLSPSSDHNPEWCAPGDTFQKPFSLPNLESVRFKTALRATRRS